MRGTLPKKGIRMRYETTRMVLTGDRMKLMLSEVDTYVKSRNVVTPLDAVELRSSKHVMHITVSKISTRVSEVRA